MINFKELRISECDNSLIIDVEVKDDIYYENIYIDQIIIDTQDTYLGIGPSSNPIYNHTVEETVTQVFTKQDVIDTEVFDYQEEDYVYVSDGGNVKNLRLSIPQSQLNVDVNSNLFFIYVSTKGIPSPETPCGEDNIITLGVVANLSPIYKASISYLSKITDKCAESRELVDFLLKINALDLALKTCNYQLAIKYWNKFFKKLYINPITYNCTCNG